MTRSYKWATAAKKKSPRKGCVPGGRRTLTFPGAIGRFRAGPAWHTGPRRRDAEGRQFTLYSKRTAHFLVGGNSLRGPQENRSLRPPVQTHLRGSLLVDSRLALAKTTSMRPRQRSGDAEDMTFPFSGQGRFLERMKAEGVKDEFPEMSSFLLHPSPASTASCRAERSAPSSTDRSPPAAIAPRRSSRRWRPETPSACARAGRRRD